MDEGQLAFAYEQGQAHLLPASDVGRLLNNHPTLQLVWLNACEGARGSVHDIFSSTASILVRHGLPAVIAMQYEITDRVAVELARTFYEALTDGYPVDAALAEARVAASLAVANTVEWGTPVLYMRCADGRLFDLAATAGPAVTPAQPRQPTPEVAAASAHTAPPRAPGPSLDRYYAEALEYLVVEQWPEAIALLSQIVDLSPDYPGAASRLKQAQRRHDLAQRFATGRAHLEAGRWQEARDTLEALLRADPDYADPIWGKASALLFQARQMREMAELPQPPGRGKRSPEQRAP
jgi:tetratricopeptide (TPR) repeat protein